MALIVKNQIAIIVITLQNAQMQQLIIIFLWVKV